MAPERLRADLAGGGNGDGRGNGRGNGGGRGGLVDTQQLTAQMAGEGLGGWPVEQQRGGQAQTRRRGQFVPQPLGDAAVHPETTPGGFPAEDGRVAAALGQHGDPAGYQVQQELALGRLRSAGQPETPRLARPTTGAARRSCLDFARIAHANSQRPIQ